MPRTGKTTVARLIGRYLYAHGVLPRDTFVERNALALKGLQQGWVDYGVSCGVKVSEDVAIVHGLLCAISAGAGWS